MLKIILSAAALLLSLSMLAQHSISGSVRDAQTNQKLPGATIRLAGANEVAIADAFGRFTFQNLKAGTYTLQVKFLGYAEKSETVDLASNTEVNISLDQ